MYYREALRTASLVLALAVGQLAIAEDVEKDEELGTVVVTASRTEESTKTIPNVVTVITAKEIEAGNYNDVVSVLEARAGLHFKSYSGNQEASVDIRGFGENSFGRVLVLRDGRKLNRPDMRSINWSQIPLASVERIEIIRGASGAIYGDSAVGGVINIITKKGADKPTGNIVVESGSNDSNRLAVGLSGGSGPISYGVSAEHAETAGWRHRTGTRTQSGDLNIGYDFNELFRMELNLNALTTQYELPGSLTKAQYEDDPRQAGTLFDEAVEDYFGVSPSFIAQVGDVGEFTLDLGYLEKDIESDMTSWGSWTNRKISSFTISPRYVHRTPVFGRQNRFTVGADWSDEAIELKRYSDANRTISAGDADVGKETLALYANNSLHVLDQLITSIGARWSVSTFDVDEVDGSGAPLQKDEDTHRENAYHAGITYNVTETSKVFVKYEHFFRLPFTDEQIVFNSMFSSSSFNKDLEPETGDSYELGYEQKFGNSTTVALTLYHMSMEDEIAYVWPSNVNLDETIHQGAELSFSSDLMSSLSLYGNYAWTVAEFDKGANEGNEIPLVPKHKLGIGTEWRILKDLRLSADVTYTSEMFQGGDFANTSEEMDDYTVVDVGAAYSINILETQAEIYARVDNVFDEHYANFVYTWGSYYPAPGRIYRFGVKWTF